MTTWHYALSREKVDDGEVWTIREVYVGDKGELSWTEDPVTAAGDSWIEAGNALALMGNAIGRPILDLTLDPPALVDPSDLPKASRWGDPMWRLPDDHTR